LAVFGAGLTMVLPWLFVVIVGAATVFSAKIGDHRPLIYAQLACITWISALIQWSIGSWWGSGLVICWSFLGPIGALLFLSVRQAVVWMGMFLGIVVISALMNPALLGAPLEVSEQAAALFLIMNMVASTSVVFVACAWFTRTIQRNVEDLVVKNQQIEQSQAALVQSEKMAALGQLVASVAQELNTPLGAIQASAGNIKGALSRVGGQWLKVLSEATAPERAGFGARPP